MAAQLEAAVVPTFSSEEVVEALSQMCQGKSSGSGIYSLDLLCGSHCSLYELIAVVFIQWACGGYPRALNTLLIMPIYKVHGLVDASDNYHTISLIHPLEC